MTYQLFKTYLIVCYSILSSPSNVWAFQPTSSSTNGHHLGTLSSTKETRTNHAVLFDSSNRSYMVPSKSILYYKNLDEHEEEQQQEVPQIQQDQGKVHTNITPSSIKTTDQTMILTNNDQNTVTTTTTTAATAADAPRTMDLPKAFFIKTNKEQNEKLFMSFEMYIGRIAMTVGVCLLTQEVLTGTSLLDQLQQF